MEKAKLTILGSGSATPTPERFQSSQLFEIRNKQFLIDCGEGAQNSMIRHGVRTARLNHIFISHLHGDHYFGLLGLMSTLGMMGRTADFEIHAQPDLERLLRPQIDYCLGDFPFKVIFHPFNPRKSEVIYDDRSLKVTTIPLKHSVPTAGFLFEEKNKPRHLRRDMAEAFGVPVSKYKEIVAGADYITPDGQVIPNSRLTTEPTKPKRFAYISDTAYSEKIVPLISGVDLLYHEATFLTEHEVRSRATLHSTAAQAATIAKIAQVGELVIGHYSARYRDVSPVLEEARAIFPNTIAAADGLVINF